MVSSSKWNVRGMLAGIALVLAAAVAPAAFAGLTNTVFSVEATSAAGQGSYTVSIAQGHWVIDGYLYEWSLAQPVEIRDPSNGSLIATITDADASYIADPQVNLSFAVTAGPAMTNFTIKSSLLSFPSIAHPSGRASAAFTVTDGDDEGGATLTGLGGESYLAQYNGFVPAGTEFTQLIQQVVAPVSGTADLSEEYPGGGAYAAIAGPAYDMSSQIAFSLSANDLASGTSNYEIIPEPCGLILLVAGAGLLRRR